MISGDYSKGTAQLGTVSSVYTESGAVLVDITMPRPGTAYRKVPFDQLAPGLIVTPAVGERVVVLTLDDGSHRAMFPQGRPAFEMPVLGESELCFRFDEESEIRVSKSGDTYTVRLAGGEVELESAGNATVTAGGEVSVDAAGDVSVTTEGNLSASADNVSVAATGTATVDASAVRLGAGESGGSRVAREGDTVRVYAPEHGWLDGEITSGSDITSTK
jgi:phage baseplate assembly protein gpV